MNKTLTILFVLTLIGLSLFGQAYANIIYAPSECKPYIEQAIQAVSTSQTTITVTITAVPTTEYVGIPAEVTYAAVAVAVIAIIAAIVLVMRRQ